MERSAGGVVFYDSGGNGPVYLVMVNRKGYWEFPKGHVDKGETDEEAALREVREETGLKEVSIVPGFQKEISYVYSSGKRKAPKQVVFYLMRTKPGPVLVSDEHLGYVWLDYDRAIKRVSYENARKVLESAHEFLMKSGALKWT